MKDVKFLDFMFKNMQPNFTGLYKEIPYYTLCGKELNFISPLDTNSALVFKDMVLSDIKSGPESAVHNSKKCKYKLLYGGTASQSFDPSKLAYSTETGRMYHELENHKYLSHTGKTCYGLLHVNITSNFFSDKLIIEEDEEGETSQKRSGTVKTRIRLQWTTDEEIDSKQPVMYDVALMD